MSPAFVSTSALVGTTTPIAPTGFGRRPRFDWAQRLFDIVVGSILLVVAVPIVGLAMAAVRLTSRGPALYMQSRLGRFGRPFVIYKIRSMTHNCEKHSGVKWSGNGDPRVTWVGRILRKLHIDELPQLFNILRGEMSLVGPRPERPEIVAGLERAIPRYRDRLGVRPGLTGLAQVQLPPDTDLESVRRKLRYDLHYIAIGGIWTDLRILVATAIHVAGFPYSVSRLLLGLPGQHEVEPERFVPPAPTQTVAAAETAVHPVCPTLRDVPAVDAARA
jgi:lipopolysaccharide/colanic/teichoic acid biosynthesis glycosyltransferase